MIWAGIIFLNLLSLGMFGNILWCYVCTVVVELMFLFFLVIVLVHVVVLVVLVSLLLLLSTGSAARIILLFYVDVLPFSRTLPFGGTNHDQLTKLYLHQTTHLCLLRLNFCALVWFVQYLRGFKHDPDKSWWINPVTLRMTCGDELFSFPLQIVSSVVSNHSFVCATVFLFVADRVIDPGSNDRSRTVNWLDFNDGNLNQPFNPVRLEHMDNLEPKAPLRCLRIVSRKGTTLPTNEFFKFALIDFQLS